MRELPPPHLHLVCIQGDLSQPGCVADSSLAQTSFETASPAPWHTRLHLRTNARMSSYNTNHFMWFIVLAIHKERHIQWAKLLRAWWWNYDHSMFEKKKSLWVGLTFRGKKPMNSAKWHPSWPLPLMALTMQCSNSPTAFKTILCNISRIMLLHSCTNLLSLSNTLRHSSTRAWGGAGSERERELWTNTCNIIYKCFNEELVALGFSGQGSETSECWSSRVSLKVLLLSQLYPLTLLAI